MSDTVLFFDTTLRDGEQSPGATMNQKEKIRLARQLEALGVDIIEAGFPAASQGDFEAVQAIAAAVTEPQVAGLCRALKSDIDRAYEAVKDAKHPRIHTFIATSDIHMKHKLGKTPDEVVEMAKAAVSHAASLTKNVEFSAEDASRSDKDFLVRIFEEVIDCGATTINVPDTVGYIQPHEFAELITYLKKNIRNIDKAVISVHCHNDLGLAVANSLAAIHAGARQAEVTLTGIGERAGNAALEEVVMALDTRRDTYNLNNNIKTDQIFPSCRLLSHIIGQPIPPYKAIVGGNAFAHESGIHQDGMLKNRQTYEIMTPESIGRKGTDLVIGKHSGRHALKSKVEELGFKWLNEDDLNVIFNAVKELADRKAKIFDEDVEALILEKIYRKGKIEKKFELQYVSVHSGNTPMPPNAAVVMKVNGEEKKHTDFGAGPVDAVFKVIAEMTGRTPTLLQYAVNAITGGTDAQGDVTVRIEENGRTAVGRGSHDDIIVASANAYINALNSLATKEEER